MVYNLWVHRKSYHTHRRIDIPYAMPDPTFVERPVLKWKAQTRVIRFRGFGVDTSMSSFQRSSIGFK
jgi:hypothetical protein